MEKEVKEVEKEVRKEVKEVEKKVKKVELVGNHDGSLCMLTVASPGYSRNIAAYGL